MHTFNREREREREREKEKERRSISTMIETDFISIRLTHTAISSLIKP